MRFIKKVVHKSSSFKAAELWDISQHISLSPEERQEVARELRYRVFGKKARDVRARVPFWDAWASKTSEKIMIKKRICLVFYIGLDQLIKNKEALRRHKDLEDLKYLRAAAKKRNKR